MNVEIRNSDRRGPSKRTAYPEKANPHRRVPSEDVPCRELRGEARSSSDWSDPRHHHRPLTDEQRELVTRFMPMARMLAGRAGKQAAEHDEMVAEAYAALVDAARTFDPERGVYFAIHARPRIVGALRDFRRFLFHANWRGRTQESPVFERLETDGDVHGQVLGMEAQAAPGQEEELAEAVRAIIHRLPRSESIACRLIYLEGKTHGEIAEVLGCTKGYVSRLQSDALARIRRVHSEALAG